MTTLSLVTPDAAPSPGASDDERLALAALTRVLEPSDVEAIAFVRRLGPVAAWEALRSGDVPPALRARLGARARAARPDADLAAADRLGARLVCPGDAEWPVALGDLDRAEFGVPLALWVRGQPDLAETVEQMVAIVGTRAATNYGVHVSGELAFDLAERDWLTVSGGAYGIDAAAHRGALAAKAPTVAVLACGVDVAYPGGNESLFARIAEHGLLVSEWPPGSSSMRHRFLVRNRIIAALGAGVVVVEAGARSGTANTVKHAQRLGRPVMVVPGPVTSAMSVGCHVLLRRVPCARLVTNAAEVVEEVGRIGDLADVPVGPTSARDALRPETARVLDAVPKRRHVPPARIAATAGVSIAEVNRALGLLAAEGLVVRTMQGYRLSEPKRRSDPDSDSVPDA